MAEKKKSKPHVLSVNDLKPGMVITAYSRFSDRYQFMDKLTSTFIRHNFKATRAIVNRDNRRLDIPIEKLKSGDTLLKIHSFPPHLKKLTKVINEKFISELKKRGMLGFQVQKKGNLDEKSKRDLQEIMKMVDLESSSKPTSRKNLGVRQEQKQRIAQKADKLIRGVQAGITLRDSAAQSIENTMDKARKGSLNIKEINNYIKNIVKSATSTGMAALSGLKEGDQIYTHCVDVGAIFHTVYFEIMEKKGTRGKFQSQDQALLGAFLHDIGKSKIPRSIIDSKEGFEKNSRGIQIIRSHPLYGAEMLARMNLPDSIIDMARFHHVKQNTEMLSSYPTGIDFADVSFESRLLAIVDIYQALVGKRKYKKSWSPPATMRYLDALAGVEYDMRIWDDFIKLMGVYPKGSLVKLNDNSLAFVMSVPAKNQNPERPLVAIVRNGSGENLRHHDLLDLSVEKDVSIVADVDAQEVFGDDALEVFTSINVS